MTVGKDVSALFADVVNCIQTDNVELKKLVYLQLGQEVLVKRCFDSLTYHLCEKMICYT